MSTDILNPYLDRFARPFVKYNSLYPTYFALHLAVFVGKQYSQRFKNDVEVESYEIVRQLCIGQSLKQGQIPTIWHHAMSLPYVSSISLPLDLYPTPLTLQALNSLLVVIFLPILLTRVLFPASPVPTTSSTEALTPDSERPPVTWTTRVRHRLYYTFQSCPSALVISLNSYVVMTANSLVSTGLGLLGVLTVFALVQRRRHIMAAAVGAVMGCIGPEIALWTLFVILWATFGDVRASNSSLTWRSYISYLAFLPMLAVWYSLATVGELKSVIFTMKRLPFMVALTLVTSLTFAYFPSQFDSTIPTIIFRVFINFVILDKLQELRQSSANNETSQQTAIKEGPKQSNVDVTTEKDIDVDDEKYVDKLVTVEEQPQPDEEGKRKEEQLNAMRIEMGWYLLWMVFLLVIWVF
nr:uncharacterized protein CI109_003835 [Kwoniella shandongensis]KAA5527863.1 hypothetical protein CI109_003835 [Kwoniella shandongensis]